MNVTLVQECKERTSEKLSDRHGLTTAGVAVFSAIAELPAKVQGR
jgi:hypothetical protein